MFFLIPISELCHFNSLGRKYPLPCIVVQTKIFSGIISTSISCFNALINEQTSLKQARKENSYYKK